jgi:hypothetical protein
MNIIGFAICLTNDSEEDFEPNKLYPVLAPLPNDPNGYLRIIDESGEDYLYPDMHFQIVQVGEQARENLFRYFETAAA